jgi:pilus assembly protein Flp/PilA
MNALVNFLKDEDGVVAIEYVVVAAALVGGLTLAFTGAGTALTTKLSTLIGSI